MIIVCEVSEMAMQTGFTEYDHVIQALAPNRADHPLDVSSLPGRSRWREHRLDTVGIENLKSVGMVATAGYPDGNRCRNDHLGLWEMFENSRCPGKPAHSPGAADL